MKSSLTNFAINPTVILFYFFIWNMACGQHSTRDRTYVLDESSNNESDFSYFEDSNSGTDCVEFESGSISSAICVNFA